MGAVRYFHVHHSVLCRLRCFHHPRWRFRTLVTEAAVSVASPVAVVVVADDVVAVVAVVAVGIAADWHKGNKPTA